MIVWLTVAEVAEQLRVTPQWVRDHCSRRRPLLPVTRLGSLLRFDLQKIREFMESPPTTTLKEEGGMARNEEPKRAGGRPRGQEGHVEKVGEKVKKWQIHWFVYELDEGGKEVRKHRSRVIGRCPGGPVQLSIADAQLPEMTKHEAQKELRRVIDQQTGLLRGSSTAKASSSVTFGWFATHRWLPVRQLTWRESTKFTNLHILNGYILPAWERTSLRDLDPVAVGEWLGRMAENFSETIVHKCRVYMKSITVEAVEQDYLMKDPLRRLIMPRTKKASKPTLTPEQIQAVVHQLVNTRDQVAFLALILTGMRPSELFASKWGDWDRTSLLVERGVVRGVVDSTKTKMSRGRVSVPKALGDLLDVWRSETAKPGNDDWIFPSEKNTPLRLDGWTRRILKPAAAAAGVELTVQMLRRSFATIASESGVSMKAVQGQLRHSAMSTTSDVYTQAPPDFQNDAVERVAKKIVNGTGQRPRNKKD